MTPLAESHGILSLLDPIQTALAQGNQAMRWLDLYSKGETIETVLQSTMKEMELEEKAFT